jgi:transcriptional regulator with XRE-family HTH domain
MRSKNGRLGKNDTTIVSEQFGVKIRTVQRIWKRGKNQLAQNIPVKVPNLKKGRCGRKAVPIDLENLRNIPLQQRMTLDDVSSRLGISKTRLHKYLKKGMLRHHSSSVKPYLTEANKNTRLKWCIDMIDQSLLDDPKFKDLFDIVFIDEKWFYLYQKSERYYLLPDEDEPHRSCKNKNYIPRIMFLCVVARPRFKDGVCVFDGKIGCFPLVTIEHAIRDSPYRLRGEEIIKPIQSITRDVIRDFMINKVLPAIRAKWPREDVHKPIFIQQDNAPTHLKVDDPQFCECAKQHGFDIRLIMQPANSPDFNILDLGFFRAIQSIQYKKNAKTLKDLIPVVHQVKDLIPFDCFNTIKVIRHRKI